MGAHTIIQKGGKKLTLKGITPKQKDALLAGGLSFAALGMGVGLFKLFNPKPNDLNISVVNKENEEGSESIGEELEDNSFEANVESSNIDTENSMNAKSIDFEESFENVEYSYSFYSDVDISNIPHDGMSFEEAFKSAREDVGPGGFFNFENCSYSTFYEEEWNNMSPEDQQKYFEQVSEKSNFNDYEESFDALEHVSSVVDEYEVIEHVEKKETQSISEKNLESENDDRIALEAQDNQNETNEENIDIESDDFFSGVDSETNENEDVTTDEDINMEEDDFFSSLTGEENSQTIGEDVPDSVIVKPIYGMDSNMDNVIDMVAIDQNEDGIADVVALDEDFDGKLESFMINEDGGDNLDVFVIDQGLDGIDASDIKEDIDDIVSMDDFVVLGENDIMEIENLDMIENLIDNSSEITHTDSLLDDSDQEDFDAPGL